MGITGVCGGEELWGWCYGVGSAEELIQESPHHGAPASGFVEVDLDHSAGFPSLETLNQRFRGEVRL